MSAHPDTLSVETSQCARVEADRADISVSVAGASLFSGAMALQKAREIAELVAALRTIEIGESQVKVEGVSAQNNSGAFSKSSSVTYALRVENVPLERIADATGIIADAKNATLSYLDWKFADETPLRDELRSKCLSEALERAKTISQTLGVRLIGVYELDEEWQGTEAARPSRRYLGESNRSVERRSRVSEEELGLAISHAETVSLQLNIQFRVSEFGN